MCLINDYFVSKVTTIVNANDTTEEINLDYSGEKPQLTTELYRQEPKSLGPNDTINLTTTPKGTQSNKYDMYQIAILPWYIVYGPQKENLLGRIADYIKKSDDLDILASCYDLSASGFNNVKIIRNIDEKDVWIKKSFFDDTKPDIKKVRNIGNTLGADAIMVAAFNSTSTGFKYLRLYLVDVTSGKLCAFNHMDGIRVYHGDFHGVISNILDNIFDDYRNTKRDVALEMN